MRFNPLSNNELYETLGKVVLDYKVSKMTWQKSSKYQEGILVVSTQDGILIGLDVLAIKNLKDNID
jgi:hypothetical protein